MSSITFNWFVLFIVFSMYLINRWRVKVIYKIDSEITELKKEKKELTDAHKKQKEFYETIVRNYSSVIEKMDEIKI